MFTKKRETISPMVNLLATLTTTSVVAVCFFSTVFRGDSRRPSRRLVRSNGNFSPKKGDKVTLIDFRSGSKTTVTMVEYNSGRPGISQIRNGKDTKYVSKQCIVPFRGQRSLPSFESGDTVEFETRQGHTKRGRIEGKPLWNSHLGQFVYTIRKDTESGSDSTISMSETFLTRANCDEEKSSVVGEPKNVSNNWQCLACGEQNLKCSSANGQVQCKSDGCDGWFCNVCKDSVVSTAQKCRGVFCHHGGAQTNRRKRATTMNQMPQKVTCENCGNTKLFGDICNHCGLDTMPDYPPCSVRKLRPGVPKPGKRLDKLTASELPPVPVVSSPTEEPGSWSCSGCTFTNKGWMQSCKMCRSERYQMPAVPKLEKPKPESILRQHRASRPTRARRARKVHFDREAMAKPGVPATNFCLACGEDMNNHHKCKKCKQKQYPKYAWKCHQCQHVHEGYKKKLNRKCCVECYAPGPESKVLGGLKCPCSGVNSVGPDGVCTVCESHWICPKRGNFHHVNQMCDCK